MDTVTAPAPVINDPRLVFDSVAHRYTLDGRELVSVTQALTLAGMVDTRHFTEAARLRGTYLHAAIALCVEGDLDESTIDVLVRPYFDGFVKFLQDTKATIECSEVRVCDPVLGYAGTLDAIVRWPNGVLTLIDWKSGAFPPMTGPQTAAYLRCARAMYPTGTNIARAGVHLRGDGTYRLVNLHQIVQDEHDWLAALRVVQFQRRHHIGS